MTSLPIRRVLLALLLPLAGVAASSVHAQGFFGGLKLSEPQGDGAVLVGENLGVGLKVPVWERTRNALASEQTAVFGGVSLGGVGLGAAMTQTRPALGFVRNHALVNPLNPPTNPGNLGVDVYSSYTLQKLTLFGRVGYERNETRPLAGFEATMIAPLGTSGIRSGTSLNYGLGVRYDVSPTLGVRAEYTRGTRFGLDRPEWARDSEPDAISVGVRLRF